MLVGRWNALEIARATAHRFTVYGCNMRDGVILSAEVADEPAETLRLPLPKREATDWLLLYFEDLAPAAYRDALEELTGLRSVAGELA